MPITPGCQSFPLTQIILSSLVILVMAIFSTFFSIFCLSILSWVNSSEINKVCTGLSDKSNSTPFDESPILPPAFIFGPKT